MTAMEMQRTDRQSAGRGPEPPGTGGTAATGAGVPAAVVPLRDPVGQLAVARDLSCTLAQREQLLAAAQADPAAFINGFCFGKDFERGIEFKARLWPWQGRLVRHLAGLQQYDEQTPFTVDQEPPRYILLKARGVGATWALIWYATWLVWARPPAQVLIMSDIEEKAVDLADRRLRFAVDSLPGELHFPETIRGDDSKTARSFANGSGIISISGDPDNIHTYHPTLAILDEASRYRTSFLAAITGLQSQVVVFSTANGLGNDFARVWADAANDRGQRHKFVPIFVPWKARPTYTHKPTGDPALQAQEYPETPEEAFLASGRPYFDLIQARQLARKVVCDPVRIEDGGCLKVWADRAPGRVYGIFADTAKGLEVERDSGDPSQERGGPDYSVAIVVDWITGEQVAEWHGRPREFPFAHTLYGLWKRYPGQIVPERNGPGEIVSLRLAEMEPPCVYFDRDGCPGWINTEQTRLAALALMSQAIVRHELVMRSAAFWREVDVFQRSPNGKPEAATGYHDDRVLARAMGELVRTSNPPPAVGGKSPVASCQLSVEAVYEEWDRGSFR